MIRLNTTCPRCGKDNAVFGYDYICNDCKLRAMMKTSIKEKLREKRIRIELNKMKPAIKQKLHDEILAQILEEQKHEI